MHYVPIGQKTSANILTEWLDLESGLCVLIELV